MTPSVSKCLRMKPISATMMMNLRPEARTKYTDAFLYIRTQNKNREACLQPLKYP